MSGAYANGLLRLEKAAPGRVGQVDVVVSYNNRAILDNSRVCLVRELVGEDWRTGVEIWVSRCSSPLCNAYIYMYQCSYTACDQTPNRHVGLKEEDIEFNITMYLPSYLLSYGNLTIDAAETDLDVTMSGFDYSYFSGVDLRTLGPISIQSLNSTGSISLTSVAGSIKAHVEGEYVEANSVAGDIQGSYTSRIKTGLHAVAGQINATLGVGGELELDTVTGDITADVSLLPASSRFLVRATSVQGKVLVDYRSQPVGAYLASAASSTVSTAEVRLASEFEGHFKVSLDIRFPLGICTWR